MWKLLQRNYGVQELQLEMPGKGSEATEAEEGEQHHQDTALGVIFIFSGTGRQSAIKALMSSYHLRAIQSE